jgi:carboxymethylenebutenolidase
MTDQSPYQNVTFASNGGTAHGYLAQPESGSGPGVIVIQEWWGLDDSIVDVADRLAREGFVALAPDLYGGRVTHDEKEAMTLATRLVPGQAVEDLSGAVGYLLGLPSVTADVAGVVGFCMGGGFALRLAARAGDKAAAAVVFYGAVSPEEDLSGIRAAVQGHFGERDESIPPGQARALMERIRTQAGVPAEEYFYDAGHAFLNDRDLIGTYDEEAAKLAWGRTVDFLRGHLAAGSR